MIINEALARKYWPGEDPIGKRISLDDPAKKPSWLTVVGIASNAKQSEWTANANPEVYLAFQQNRAYLEEIHSSVSYLTLVVRTSGDPAGIAPAVQNEIHSIAKDVTLSHVQTMDEVVAESTAQPRLYVVTLGAFAAVALILAAVGIYGVMSYSVSRRTHELGIRMTLGAERSAVLRLVVGQGMILALVGASVGLLVAFVLTRLMASLLYGVQPHDPATFFAVALVLGGVALAANYIPARRASRVDPMVALRYE